jgi:hypothetical protein
MIVAGIGLLLLLAAAVGYWLQSRVMVTGPTADVLASAVGAGLPPYVKVGTLQVLSSERQGSGTPMFRTRVRTSLIVASDTYVESSSEDAAVIVAPHMKQGDARQAEGTAVSTLSDGAWRTEFSWDGDPISGLGRPRESFDGRHVIVQGSPDETAFREEQRQQREAGEQAARLQREQQAANEQRIEEARLQAERTKAEALAAQQRAEAAHRAELEAAELEAQRRREAAERAAREEAERRKADEESAASVRAIPVGTELDVRLMTTLNSGQVRVEDRFEAAAVQDVVVGGRTRIPAGSILRGVVASVQSAGRLKRKSSMTLTFDQITINGRSYPIHGVMTKAVSGPGIKGDAAKVGAGAAVGAIIGGILGGGKGALAGILVGAGGTVAATEGKEVELAQGSVVRVRIDSIQQP